MLTRIQASVGIAVILAVTAAVLWAFIEAVQAEPAVAGSIGVAVVGVLGVVWQQRQTEKARLREVHRGRMSPVYDDLLGVLWNKLAGSESDQIDPEVEAFFRDLKARQLMLGASSEMVQDFNRWTDLVKAAAATGDNDAIMAAWEFLLRAIRSDLGHDDSSLPPGELLRLFLKPDSE
jgi:hypothetical protein